MYGAYKLEDIQFMILGAGVMGDEALRNVISDFQIGFRLFVNKYFGDEMGDDNGHSWHRLIKFFCGDNGFYEIERFGVLFEAYINNRPEDVMPISD
jgi:hypothetical protein